MIQLDKGMLTYIYFFFALWRLCYHNRPRKSYIEWNQIFKQLSNYPIYNFVNHLPPLFVHLSSMHLAINFHYKFLIIKFSMLLIFFKCCIQGTILNWLFWFCVVNFFFHIQCQFLIRNMEKITTMLMILFSYYFIFKCINFVLCT